MKAPHYYLCTCRPLQDGTCALQMVIYRHHSRAQMSSGVRLLPSQWDGRKVINHPQRAQLNSYLDQKRTAFEAAMLAAELAGELCGKSAAEVAAFISKRLSGEDAAPTATFADTFQTVIDGYTKGGRTADLYRSTLKRLGEYDNGLARRSFAEIDARYISSFDRWLSRTSPSANARAIHLRNIRHVFNFAIDNDITTAYPFLRLKIKTTETRKRAMDAESLRLYFAATPPSELKPWHDLMKLTFLLIGINCADLHGLRIEDYCGGRLQYRRRKTGKLYDIRIEPEAQAIIEEYRGEKRLLFPAERFTNSRNFLKALNEKAKEIDSRFPNITTYTLRHSWATIAYNDLRIPKDTISQALGHQYGSRVTSVYIDADRSLVDDANRRVIDWVLYGRK